MISTITLGLLAAIASGAAIANPAPAPEFNNEITNVPAGPLQLGKRDLTYLYVCSDINFQGKCLNLEINRGQCCMFSKFPLVPLETLTRLSSLLWHHWLIRLCSGYR